MSWFSKKKEEKQEQKPLSFRSDFPKFESELPRNNLQELKQTIAPPPREMRPLRPMNTLSMKPFGTPLQTAPRDDDFELPPQPEMTQRQPRPVMQKPMEITSMPTDTVKQGKNMFVKIEQYDEALNKMDLIATQLQDAEGTMQKIEELRTEEAKELGTWKEKIQDVKNQLKTIDRSLFGR